MASIAGVNPNVLVWARERAGLSIDQVADALGKPAEVIIAWESGEKSPSYGQLEKLAYTHYHRPLAVFFFPEPPEESDARAEFRMLLPDVEALDPDTLYAAREAQANQESLRELSGGINSAERRLLSEIHLGARENLLSRLPQIRLELGVSLADQRVFRNLDDAFKGWRAAIESRGIFVFKRSFTQKNVSGFCLYDAEFPVIYINNSTSHARQIFSLFHELAHLLYASSGVTIEGESHIESLSGDLQQIEIRCNQFAGAFLVPDRDFNARAAGAAGTDEEVSELASYYRVSREVILRKLLDRHVISQEHYQRKAAEYAEEWRRSSEAREPGGSYYRTQAAYLSPRYTELAFASYYSGRTNEHELAGYLGMKARNVEKFEALITGRPG